MAGAGVMVQVIMCQER